MSVMVTNFKCEKKSIVLLICKTQESLDELRRKINAIVPGGIPSALNKKYSEYGYVVSIRSNVAREYIKTHTKSLRIRVISVIEQL